jgi:hypothetical protein
LDQTKWLSWPEYWKTAILYLGVGLSFVFCGVFYYVLRSVGLVHWTLDILVYVGGFLIARKVWNALESRLFRAKLYVLATQAVTDTVVIPVMAGTVQEISAGSGVFFYIEREQTEAWVVSSQARKTTASDSALVMIAA